MPGPPVRFTDHPDSTNAYSLGGLAADRDAVTIESSTGQIKTSDGATYDHGTKPVYHVIVVGTSSDDPDLKRAVEITIRVVTTDPRIIVSTAALIVDEGSSSGSAYTVRLASKPSGNVALSISGHAGTDVSVSRASIAFTTGNWNSARNVLVTAAHDADTGNDIVSLSHRASGGGYDAASATVTVTVRDDDEDNEPAAGLPAINGATSPLTVGTTLTVSTSGISDDNGLTNPSFRYQWRRSQSNISGATNTSYTVQQADVGHAIRVRVSFEDDAGHAESLSSDPTAAVASDGDHDELPTLTIYAVTSSISEGGFTRFRIERAGDASDRIDAGLSCRNSGTGGSERVAVIVPANATTATATGMFADNTDETENDRSITCRLNSAYSNVHNIGSPSSATVNVDD